MGFGLWERGEKGAVRRGWGKRRNRNSGGRGMLHLGVSVRRAVCVLCNHLAVERTSITQQSNCKCPPRTANSAPFPHSHPPPSLHIYRTFPVALAGAPRDPCLDCIFAPGWPLAPATALFAFSAFFLLSLAVFFSFPSLMAACRAACRASGRCERRSLITSREAPTMPRWDFTVRRVRFLAISCVGGSIWVWEKRKGEERRGTGEDGRRRLRSRGGEG